MLALKIGNKEYNIEYTVEASLCDECVEKVTGFMCNIVNVEGQSAIKSVIKTLTDLPNTVLSLLYAGLLENHGVDSGDKTIRSKDDAKKLLKEYIREHKEDGTGNYYELLGMFIEQMGEDGFFELIGLESMIQMTQTKEEEVKKPQDHKRKQK